VSVPSCGTTSSSVVITELPSPIANFSQTIIGLTSTFTDLSTGSPTRWRWDFGDGSAFDNTPNPSHTYASVGTYTVTLTVGNEICSNSLSKSISLNPNSINPILENDKLSIYPNPAKDLIYIQLNENIKTPIEIEITNTLGENVLSKKITQSISNNLYSLNIEHLSSGVYYIKTRDKNNKISIGKFVVDK
jgi:PKD repeat protein